MPNETGYAKQRAARHRHATWHPDSDSNGCELCHRPIAGFLFGKITNKHHCYQCGIIICKNCISPIKLNQVNRLAGTTKTYDRHNFVQVCRTCGNNHLGFLRAGRAPAPYLNINAIFNKHAPRHLHDAIKAGIYYNSHSKTKAKLGFPITEEKFKTVSAADGRAYFSLLITCSAVIIWQEGSRDIMLYHNIATCFGEKTFRFPPSVASYIRRSSRTRMIIISAIANDTIAREYKKISFNLQRYGIDMDNVRIFGNASAEFSIYNGELGLAAR